MSKLRNRYVVKEALMTRRIYQRVALLMVLLVVLMGTLPHRSSARPSTTELTTTTATVSADAQQQPENNEFNTISAPLDPSTYPANYNFAQARQALAASTYPANYNFASGTLTGWTASDAARVRVLNDIHSLDGAYLHLDGPNQWALSDAFVVPLDTQSLRFDYMAWTPRNAKTEASRLYVEVYSGGDFATYTHLATVDGTHNQRWKQGVVNFQSFQGQRIKLRMRVDDFGFDGKNGQVRLDNLTLHTEVPAWTPSDAARVRIVNDANSIDGAYLHLDGANQSATSAPFSVPQAAQTVRFDYTAWTPRNANEGTSLYVEVYSGSDFATYTLLATVGGTHNQRWQQGVVNVQAFRGQTVKLRMRVDDFGFDGKNGQVRLDNLSMYPEIPGWIPSDPQLVRIGDTQLPSSTVSVPENLDFLAKKEPLDFRSYPTNYNFSQGRQALAVSSYPTNYNFASGTLSGWSASDPSFVQVNNDGNGTDGAYLHLNGPNRWALSDAFVVPTDTQSLRFDFMAWAPRNPDEQSRLYIEVYSGTNFEAYTLITTVQGSFTQGWKKSLVDLQAFRGQTIKLRARVDDFGFDGRNGQVRLDNLTLHTEVPHWVPSDAAQVQIVNDTRRMEGAYLYLNGANQSATSTPFRVPATAQSLRFNYMSWAPRDSNERSRLYVEIFSGHNFEAYTLVGTLDGTLTEGWKQGVANLQAFQNQTVKVRVRADDFGYDGRNGQVRNRYCGNVCGGAKMGIVGCDAGTNRERREWDQWCILTP
jgi:hypothetical protein